MPRKGTGKDAESAEFQAFDALVKKVVAVPKTELDRREAEARKSKPKIPRKAS